MVAERESDAFGPYGRPVYFAPARLDEFHEDERIALRPVGRRIIGAHGKKARAEPALTQHPNKPESPERATCKPSVGRRGGKAKHTLGAQGDVIARTGAPLERILIDPGDRTAAMRKGPPEAFQAGRYG